MLVWIYCEYCLCFRDDVDTPDCIFCRFSFFSAKVSWYPRFISNNVNTGMKESLLSYTCLNFEQLAQRLFTATYYVWIAYMLPMVRAYMILQTILIIIPSALWISSIHVDYPNRLALVWIALFIGKASPKEQPVSTKFLLLTSGRSFWCDDYHILFPPA